MPDQASMAGARTGGASLDALRFFAASFILFYHFGFAAPVSFGEVVPLFQQGWLATDFFLLLSGYILSRAYGRQLAELRMPRAHFFLRRFARLWPSHMVVLTAFGVFVLVSIALGFLPKHPGQYDPLAFFAQTFLVHGWGMFATTSWNLPTWTLSVLLVCYGLFSIYVPWLYNRSITVLAAIAAVVLAAAHMLALGLGHHAFVDLPFRWGLLRGIPLFLLGNLIERMTVNLRVDHTVFWLILAGVLTNIVLLALQPRSAVIDSMILLLLALLLAVSGAVTFAETRLTQRLGRVSFSLFLVHSLVGAIWFGIVAKLVVHFGLPMTAQWALWSTGLVLALITAFVFEVLIDRPLSAWVSRRNFLKREAVLNRVEADIEIGRAMR